MIVSRSVISFVAYVLAASASCVAMAAEPLPEGGPATSQPAPKFTLDLTRLLADPAGWAAKLDAERQALQTIITESRKPSDKAAAHLAMANWLLAVPTAMPATRWMMDMEETPADRRTLTETAGEAQEHLLEARQRLEAERDELEQADPEDDQTKERKERLKQLQATLENLEPFAELLATATSNGDDESRKSAWSRAARGMAGLREAMDDELAASALLWQAFAWALAGRYDRAQLSLPMALEAPKQPCYDFMNRLLRCRILTDAGQYAAATALTIRIRSACPAWFRQESPEAIEARQRLAGLLQCWIGQFWMVQLRASDTSANADRLEAMLARVQQSLFPGPDALPAVYHLERTIPIIAEPPKIEPAATMHEPPATQAT